MQPVNNQQVTKMGTNLSIFEDWILKADLDFFFFVFLSMYYTETEIPYVIVIKVTCWNINHKPAVLFWVLRTCLNFCSSLE